jgi:hypothetical protein
LNDLSEIVGNLHRQIQVSQNNISARNAQNDILFAETGGSEELLYFVPQIGLIAILIIWDTLELREYTAGEIALQRGDQHILSPQLDSNAGLQVNHG